MRQAEFRSDFVALDVTEGRDTHTLKLLEKFVVYSGVLDVEIIVPKGFVFDGESIPPALQWLVPPFGQSKRGACVHDYLYRYAGYHDSKGVFRKSVTRTQADHVYRELIEAKGLPTWRANMRWSILRMVGWAAWDGNSKTHGQNFEP